MSAPSAPTWQTACHKALRRDDRPIRAAVVGFGHELRGDDAAGIAVARALGPLVDGLSDVFVIDAGTAPENQTGPLRRFAPDLVVLVDAAQMGEPPGAVRWLDWQETSGLSASTHTLPPFLVARFLAEDVGCAVALIGLQPAHNTFDAPLSAVMQRAVADVVTTLADLLTAAGPASTGPPDRAMVKKSKKGGTQS